MTLETRLTEIKKRCEAATEVIELNKSDKLVIIDKDCYPVLKNHKWSYDKNDGYAYTCFNSMTLRMQHFLMGTRIGFVVDHINRDKLDNRMSNLRFCRSGVNNQNGRPYGSTGFKGIKNRSYKKNKFSSSIMFEGQAIWLGTFDDLIGAAWAYDFAAYHLYGENAFFNFPPDDYNE